MDLNIFEQLARADSDKGTILSELERQIRERFRFPELNTGDGRERVWAALFAILDNSSSSSALRTQILSVVRILTRDQCGLDVVVTSERLHVLTDLAALTSLPHGHEVRTNGGGGVAISVREEALKCLCNLSHQSERVRRQFSISAGASSVFESTLQTLHAMFLSHDQQQLAEEAVAAEQLSHTCRLFHLRLVFLLVSLSSDIRSELLQSDTSLGDLVDIVERLVTQLSEAGLSNAKTDTSELASEAFKIVYSVLVGAQRDSVESHVHVAHCTRLTGVASRCVQMPAAPAALINHAVQVLTAVPECCYNQWCEDDTSHKCCSPTLPHTLLSLLEHSLSQDKQQSNTDRLIPLLLLLCLSCKAVRRFRKFFKNKILPHRRDVTVRPGHGTNLKDRLIQLMTSPNSEISQLSAQFLFVICKEDVERLVKYTGYGNAAGLLSARGLMLGDRGANGSCYSSESESDTEEYLFNKHSIDPVTGSVEPERPDPMEGYSEERKIFETEKLMMAIQRSIDMGGVRPCRIGEDGRVQPVSHVLELQRENGGSTRHDSHSDSD